MRVERASADRLPSLAVTTGQARRLVDRALAIGADPADSTDQRFRKRLLVGVALLILPIAFVWGCLYWVIGEHAVALTPWAYLDRKSTRLNSSHLTQSRMPSSA